MKKILLFSGMVVLALVLSGCGQKDQATETGSQSQNTGDSKSSMANQVINSAETVKDALLKGQALECTYKMNGGNSLGEIKGYMDGKRYKSSFEINGEKHISVMDGETMYSWSENFKQGTKMSVQCMQDLGKSLPQSDSQTSYKSPENMADNMTDINCQPASTTDFSVPSDVTFTDTCQQMKDSLQKMKGFQTGKEMPGLK